MASAIGRAVDRVRSSRWWLVAALAILLTTGSALAWGWLRPRPPALVAVPMPDLTKAERVAQRHLAQTRAACERVLAAPQADASAKAKGYGELGKVFLAYGYAEAAEACFRNAAVLHPDDSLWRHGRAWALKDLGRTAEAREAMIEAIRLMEVDPAVPPRVLVAAWCFAGDVALQLDRPEAARADLESALRVGPRSLFALVKLGQIASAAGDGPRAIDYYQQALEVQPGRPEVRRLLAGELRRRGDVEGARAADVVGQDDNVQSVVTFADPLRSAIQGLNLTAARQMRLGRQQRETGRLASAAACFERAARIEPTLSAAWLAWGDTLIAQGNWEAARVPVAKALELAPDDDQAKLANMKLRARDPSPAVHDRALADLNAFCQERPEDPERHGVLVEALARLGHHDEALATSEAVAGRDASLIWPRLAQIRALVALKRYPEARAAIDTLLETFPRSNEVRHFAARLLAACPDAAGRDGAKALALVKPLVQAQPTVVRKETLSLALAEVGQFEEALAEIRSGREQFEKQDRAGADSGLRRRLAQVESTLAAKRAYREDVPFGDVGGDPAPDSTGGAEEGDEAPPGPGLATPDEKTKNAGPTKSGRPGA